MNEDARNHEREDGCKRFHFGLLPRHYGKCWHLPAPIGKSPFCVTMIVPFAGPIGRAV
jgi:hypothetical protein